MVGWSWPVTYLGAGPGTSPTDNDLSAYGGNKVTVPTMNCDVCADMCSRNVNITGYPYTCLAFECTPSLADPTNVAPLGAHCELWSKPAMFAGASSPQPPYSAYYCYVKNSPPPAPPPNYMIAGYSQLLNDGKNGPCRGAFSLRSGSRVIWWGMGG